MGHFIGQRLNFLSVNATARRMLGSRGLKDVLSMDNGFFLFKFRNEEAIESILEEGP